METSPPPGTYTLVYLRAAVQLHCYLAYTAAPCEKSSPKEGGPDSNQSNGTRNREHGVHQA